MNSIKAMKTDRLTDAYCEGPHVTSVFPGHSNIIKSGKPAEVEIQWRNCAVPEPEAGEGARDTN